MASGTYSNFYELSVDGSNYTLANNTDLTLTGTVRLEESTDNNSYVAGESVTRIYSDTNAGANATLFYQGTITLGGTAYPVFSTTSGGGTHYVASDTTLTPSSGTSALSTGATPACFFAGTLIATPTGERAIEGLQPGDLVITREGVQPIKFVARSTRGLNELRATSKMPVRIQASALGQQLPSQDLWMSPSHAVVLSEHLIEAGALLNGTSVEQPEEVGGLTVTYYNIELERHGIIRANGVEVESYFANWRSNGFSRDSWDNYSDYVALHGEGVSMEEMALPRVPFARQLPAEVRLQLQLHEATPASAPV